MHPLVIAALIFALAAAGDDETELGQLREKVVAAAKTWLAGLWKITALATGSRRKQAGDLGQEAERIADEIIDFAQNRYADLDPDEVAEFAGRPDDATVERFASTVATRYYNESALALNAPPTAEEQAAAEAEGNPWLPIEVDKVWISQGDTKVRTLHRRLHGQTRDMGADFWRWPASGQQLAFPGDPRAPIDARINCRCFLVFSPKGQRAETEQALTPADLGVSFDLAPAEA